MVSSLVQLLATFSVLFTPPAGAAAEPIALPLPQEIDYAMYLRGQLLAANFSTDPRAAAARVAAEQLKQPLEAFIINYESCVQARDAVAYRLVVRNVGQAVIDGVVAQFRYPAGRLDYKESKAMPAGSAAPQGAGKIGWNIGTLLPGHENWRELNVTFVAAAAAGEVPTEVTVSGGGGLALTSHTIPNYCPPTSLPSGSPLPQKNPVILCDPADTGCAEVFPLLGSLFRQVTQDPGRQPIVCSPNDPRGCTPNQPQLGVRFAETVASLLPGECSVVEDAILAEPDFQDGLNRRADVAAFFMRPLYDSGQDFSRLVLENEMLGIKNMLHAKEILRAIYTKHWHQRIEPLENVLRGGLTTNAIRARINQWHLDWVAETRQAQQDLTARYTTMQTIREKKIDPVANQAIIHAKNSLERACGVAPPPPRDDGGLRPLLFEGPQSVKQHYIQTLDQRRVAYNATQQLFVDPNNPIFPEANRATTWQNELRVALDAFDAGKPQPLERFIARIPQKDQTGFDTGWRFTYLRHAEADVDADDQVRLSHWEAALDTPKKAVAECARDTTLAARVEVSWCESGIYPSDYILREAPAPAKAQIISPPQIIEGGDNALIDVQQTVGVSCRGLPGDPYWAADCSCNCNQLIPGLKDGNILFCQAGKKLAEPPQIPVIPPPPGEKCAPYVCSNGTSFPSCTPGGLPINYLINPCATQPGGPAVSTQPIPLPTKDFPRVEAQSIIIPLPSSAPADPIPSAPPSGQGAKPIIRHDIYSIAQAPRTQDECLQERPLDNHFLVEYP